MESADALLHVIPDRLPPALVDVYGSGNQVTLHFHESLNRASASNPENYQIMNLEVREARYLEDQKAVQLTTATQKPLADYTIELGPIADRSDRANILRSAVRFQSADTNYAYEVLDDPVRLRFDQPSAGFESEVSENDPSQPQPQRRQAERNPTRGLVESRPRRALNRRRPRMGGSIFQTV